jgi:hypothetical protein
MPLGPVALAILQVAATAAVSLLFRPKIDIAKPEFKAATIPSVSKSKPVPVIFGTVKTAPNIVWYGDIRYEGVKKNDIKIGDRYYMGVHYIIAHSSDIDMSLIFIEAGNERLWGNISSSTETVNSWVKPASNWVLTSESITGVLATTNNTIALTNSPSTRELVLTTLKTSSIPSNPIVFETKIDFNGAVSFSPQDITLGMVIAEGETNGFSRPVSNDVILGETEDTIGLQLLTSTTVELKLKTKFFGGRVTDSSGVQVIPAISNGDTFAIGIYVTNGDTTIIAYHNGVTIATIGYLGDFYTFTPAITSNKQNLAFTLNATGLFINTPDTGHIPWATPSEDEVPLTTNATLNFNKPRLFGGDKDGEGGIVGTADVEFGGPTQSKNTYLTSVLGSNIPAYRGVMGLVVNQSYMGAINPRIKPWKFVARGIPTVSGLTDAGIGDDANPAHIVYKLLTSRIYGLGRTGISESDIDIASFQTTATKLQNEGFGLSLGIFEQVKTEEYIANIEAVVSGDVFQNPVTGLFEFTLRREEDINDIPSLRLLDETNIESLEGFGRPAQSEIPNEIVLKYTPRGKTEEVAVTVQDLAAIQSAGGVISQTISFEGISNANIASQVAQRELKKSSSGLARVEVVTDRSTFDIVKGQAVRFAWAKLGISQLVCRVSDIDYGGLESGTIRITLVQDVFNLGIVPTRPTTETAWITPRQNPNDIPNVYITEASYWDLLTQTQLRDVVGGGIESGKNYLIGYAGAVTNDEIDNDGNPTGNKIFVETILTRMMTRRVVDRVTLPVADQYEEAAFQRVPDVSSGDQTIHAVLDQDITLGENVYILPYTLPLGVSYSRLASIPSVYCVVNQEYFRIIAINPAYIHVERAVIDTLPQQHTQGDIIYFGGRLNIDEPWDAFSNLSEPLDTSVVMEAKLIQTSARGEYNPSLALPVTMHNNSRNNEFGVANGNTDPTNSTITRHSRPFPAAAVSIDLQFNPDYMVYGSETADRTTLRFTVRNKQLLGSGMIGHFFRDFLNTTTIIYNVVDESRLPSDPVGVNTPTPPNYTQRDTYYLVEVEGKRLVGDPWTAIASNTQEATGEIVSPTNDFFWTLAEETTALGGVTAAEFIRVSLTTFYQDGVTVGTADPTAVGAIPASQKYVHEFQRLPASAGWGQAWGTSWGQGFRTTLAPQTYPVTNI